MADKDDLKGDDAEDVVDENVDDPNADDDLDGDDADENGEDDSDDADENDGDELDPKRLHEALRKQRKNERRLAKELKQAKAELAKARKGTKQGDEDDDEPDAKRSDAIDTLTRKYQEATVRAELVEAGIPKGRVKAAMAVADIEFDDDGDPVDLDEAIEELRAEHGYLFDSDDQGKQRKKRREGSGNAGAGGRKRDGTDVVLTAEQRDLAKRAGMTPDEYIKWNSPRN